MYEAFTYFVLTWLVCGWVSVEIHYDRSCFIEKLGGGVFIGFVYNCVLWIVISLITEVI